jgi:hypothetical protein
MRCSTYGEMRNAKPKRRKPLYILKQGWEENIKLDLKELGYESLGWISLSQNIVQCSCEHNN